MVQMTRELAMDAFRNMPADRIEIVGDCWVWKNAVNSKGYPCVGINKVTYLVHHLVWLVKHGPVPKTHQIHHRCENKRCINDQHLELLTPTEHAGRHSKLSDDDIRVIRLTAQLRHQTTGQIAKHFEIDRKSAYYIIKGRRRPNIEPDSSTVPLPKIAPPKYANRAYVNTGGNT